MFKDKLPDNVVALIGTQPHKLKILKYLKSEFVSGRWKHLMRCECDCGRQVTVRHDYLLKGQKKHCGCVPVDRSNMKPPPFIIYQRKTDAHQPSVVAES